MFVQAAGDAAYAVYAFLSPATAHSSRYVVALRYRLWFAADNAARISFTIAAAGRIVSTLRVGRA